MPHSVTRGFETNTALCLCSCAAFLLIALCPSGPAHAAGDEPSESSATSAKPKLGVLRFQGAGAEKLQSGVVRALQQAGYRVAELGGELSGQSSDDALVAAAEDQGLAALVVGKVNAQAGKQTLLLSILNGADAQGLSTAEFSAPNAAALEKKVNQNVAAEIGPALADAEAPERAGSAQEEQDSEGAGADSDAKSDAEPEPEPEDEPAPAALPAASPAAAADAESEADAAEDRRFEVLSAIELLVGLRGFSRNFEYEDAVPRLPEYSLGSAPAIFIQARAYPLATTSSGMLANLGITGGFEQGIALTSRVPDGRELESSSHSFFAGLRARIPLARHELGFAATYGQHRFELTGDEEDPLVPDVDYRFVRLGLDGRFRFSSVVIGFQLGRRFLTDAGQIASDEWFPHLAGGGIDAGLYGGIGLSPSFDLLLGFDIQRYFFDLNPNGGDRILTEKGGIAGGAVDQYLSGWAGVAWRLPGQ